ncbi:MAG: DUF3084 domain-containing protein [Armatimonadota bacterium]
MLFLALIIIVVSGLIAYIGDLVGRRMGRKRLSLFGLRPKHTAIVISVGVGMIIATITLIGTLAVSKPVRDAFLTPIATLKADLEREKQEVSRTDAKLRLTTADLIQQTADLHEAQEKANAIRLKLSNTQMQLGVKKQQLSAVNMQLGRTKKDYDKAKKDLVAAKTDIITSYLRLAKARELLVNTGKLQIALEGQINALEGQKDKLEANISVLTDRANYLGGGYYVQLYSRLAFLVEQEILTGVISTKTSRQERAIWVKNFISTAEYIARRNSPKFPKDKSALVFSTTDKPGADIETEKVVQELVTRIGVNEHNDEVIIRFTAMNNAPINEQVFVALDKVDVSPNDKTYTAGNEIAHLDLTVSRQDTQADVLGHLVNDLVHKKVFDAFDDKQMIVITRRFDPAHPDTVVEISLSFVPLSELLAASEKACSLRGKVKITARARVSMRRAGPLDVVLDVEPAQ